MGQFCIVLRVLSVLHTGWLLLFCVVELLCVALRCQLVLQAGTLSVVLRGQFVLYRIRFVLHMIYFNMLRSEPLRTRVFVVSRVSVKSFDDTRI